MPHKVIPIHLNYSRTNSFLLLTYYYFEQVILVYFLVMVDDVVASHGELAVIVLELLVHAVVVENDLVSVYVHVRQMMSFVHLSLVHLSYHDVSSLLLMYLGYLYLHWN